MRPKPKTGVSGLHIMCMCRDPCGVLSRIRLSSLSLSLSPSLFVFFLASSFLPRWLSSPTLSPTDPVPRGLLTLCPWASSGPQGLYTAYTQLIYSLYTAYTHMKQRYVSLLARA